MPMSQPTIVLLDERAIRIDFPCFFRNGDTAAHQDFLRRAFGLPQLVSVELDRSRGVAVLRLHPRKAGVAAVLNGLAESFDRSPELFRTQAAFPGYFVLQQAAESTVYARAPRPVTGLRRLFYGGLSAVSLGLGVIGVVTPLLPTTPFVIASSYCALRASPRLNQRLLRSRLFGPLLRDWHRHRALRASTKRRVLLFMVLVFALSVALIGLSWSSMAIALTVSLLSFGFMLRLPTVEHDSAGPAGFGPTRNLPLAVTA
jgi:uncharacterized protein